MENVWLAFGLTLFAGLATGIGSIIGLFAKRTNTKVLALALGFSAGVMIYISFVEIFFEALEMLEDELGVVAGSWVTVASFFGGIFIIALIDRLVPKAENPHEYHKVEDINKDLDKIDKSKLARMGLFTALAIAIHNFPEGIVTFTATLADPSLGIMIAIAIALHNIPEGLAVSVPIYYATGSRKKAFIYSFLSGLAEPLGALLAFLILMPFLNDILFGILFAGVAGIMVFIAIDELIPTAREYDDSHLSIYGFIGGMGVMAISLLLFL